MIHDFNYYSSNFLKILTKTGELLPFKLNTYQKRMVKVIEEQRKQSKPVRIIVLKARQIGISTFCTAATYHKSATDFYKRAAVVADDTENTSNLFNMCKRYHQFSPGEVRPMQRYSNAKALVFENPNEKLREQEPGLLSSITLQSSNKLTAGRSGTTNYLHLSELAYWSNAGTTLTGLLQSVPLIPDSMVFIESTANGIAGRGEEFYLRWKAAESGESDFTPMFFPWHENPEYELTPPQGFTPTLEEKELMRQYDLSLPKIAWRRYKIRNDMGSALLLPVEQFNQEYPDSPSAAFIASGRTVFKNSDLVKMIDDAKGITFKRYEL